MVVDDIIKWFKKIPIKFGWQDDIHKDLEYKHRRRTDNKTKVKRKK